MFDKSVLETFKCQDCSERLIFREDKLFCPVCNKKIKMDDKRIYFLERDNNNAFKENSNDVLINRLKVFFKKYSKIFNIFYYTFGAIFVGKSAKQAIKDVGKGKIILNLGSGIKRVREDIINVDFYPFTNVDVVADISNLPFVDRSVDFVINEFVLEHTTNPERIIGEINRVLKPGGLVYISVPFIENFHSSPSDYFRWTKQGLRESMKDFEEVDMNIRSGPASALVSILTEWFAILLCFGSKKIQQLWIIFFMIILSPLKLFDYIMFKMPNADNIAFAFYYIGRKK